MVNLRRYGHLFFSHELFPRASPQFSPSAIVPLSVHMIGLAAASSSATAPTGAEEQAEKGEGDDYHQTEDDQRQRREFVSEKIRPKPVGVFDQILPFDRRSQVPENAPDRRRRVDVAVVIVVSGNRLIKQSQRSILRGYKIHESSG